MIDWKELDRIAQEEKVIKDVEAQQHTQRRFVFEFLEKELHAMVDRIEKETKLDSVLLEGNDEQIAIMRTINAIVRMVIPPALKKIRQAVYSETGNTPYDELRDKFQDVYAHAMVNDNFEAANEALKQILKIEQEQMVTFKPNYVDPNIAGLSSVSSNSKPIATNGTTGIGNP